MNPSPHTRNAEPVLAFDRSAQDASTATTVPRATAHVIALAELPPTNMPSGAPVIDAGRNPLLQVKATLQVSVGDIEMSIGELLDAREHQVFVLDRAVDQPVDILLDGRVIARGELVAVDDQFAVRLTELPLPLTSASSSSLSVSVSVSGGVPPSMTKPGAESKSTSTALSQA